MIICIKENYEIKKFLTNIFSYNSFTIADLARNYFSSEGIFQIFIIFACAILATIGIIAQLIIGIIANINKDNKIQAQSLIRPNYEMTNYNIESYDDNNVKQN